MSAVTPVALAQPALDASSSVAVVEGDAGREAASSAAYLSGLVGDDRDRVDALGGELARDLGRTLQRSPSIGWPPVIATAPFARIL